MKTEGLILCGPVTWDVQGVGKRDAGQGSETYVLRTQSHGKDLGVVRFGLQTWCAFSWQDELGQVTEHLYLFPV